MIGMMEIQNATVSYNNAANELSAARKNAIEALRRLEAAEQKYQMMSLTLLDLVSTSLNRDFNDQTAPTIVSPQVREHLTERRIVLDAPQEASA